MGVADEQDDDVGTLEQVGDPLRQCLDRRCRLVELAVEVRLQLCLNRLFRGGVFGRGGHVSVQGVALAAGAGSVYGTLLLQRVGGCVVLGPIVLLAGVLPQVRLTARRVAALAAVVSLSRLKLAPRPRPDPPDEVGTLPASP